MTETPNPIPASHLDILHKKGFGHIATIGPDGAPQSSPVWFDFDGEHVLFGLTTTRQKYRNLTARPELAISIIDPDNPYRYIEIRGHVASIDDDPEFAFINSMSKKYIDQDVYPFAQSGEHRVRVMVHPHHVSVMG